ENEQDMMERSKLEQCCWEELK
ncbi:unnamed protein product, partial [Litomosoides sigmodontis]